MAFVPECPHTIERPVMMMHWDTLTFLHWSFPAETVQRLLPRGLEVQTFDGRAWVGLVPFFMGVWEPHMGPVPWLSFFPETNVRTYVTAPDGTEGVWFFSLEAARAAAVATARVTYRLPYFWSRMQVARTGDFVSYTSHRRWPGPIGARNEVLVERGAPFEPDELGDLDHFLTARWRLYSAPRSGLSFALAHHEPWPLRRVRVLHLDDELVRSAGLPAPEGPPLAHHADRVTVRVSLPAAIPGR